MFNQQFNIDQQKFTQESLKDTATTVQAMKSANTALKQQFKEIDIDEIEDLHDDMEDMMYMNEEIQDVMGRAFNTEVFDDDELLGELNELENDMLTEDFDEVPNYLVNATTASKNVERQATPQQQNTYSNYGSQSVVRNVPL
jgi:charged multivesicular body protein 5